MNKIAKSILGVAAAVGMCLVAAPAAHADESPEIVGGTTAPLTPWAVQLSFGDSRGTYGCSGEQIAPQYVLTAKHCIDGAQWMDVYFSNSTVNRGTPIAADRVYGSPSGDVALVHLSKAKSSSSYAKLASSYTPRAGDQAVIMGYGLRANRVQSTGLFQASVQVLGTSTDAYYGSAIHVRGINGASNHGDSGGPILVNGVVVGVCSTGDTADPGANINAGSNYANLTNSRSWIRNIAGV